MTVKNVLVHVDDSRHREKTNQVAILIADKFGADLTGCYVIPNIALALAGAGPGGALAPEVIDDMQAEAEGRAAAAERDFRNQMRSIGRESEWTLINAEASSIRFSLAQEGRYADVIVVGQRDPEESIATDSGLASDLVVDAGRPVILAPYGKTAESIGENVIIGWNDSREAARAVYDALPFLVRAKKVTVAEAIPENSVADEARPGSRIGDVLRKHGINVQVDPIYGVEDKDTANGLLTRAENIRADLLVMGGYSHSRLREGLFGGVTKSMIEDTTIPTLMSH